MKTGAVNLDECPYGAGNRCRCDVCAICGYRKHTAVHGPIYGEKPGTKPYDHEFKLKLKAEMEK